MSIIYTNLNILASGILFIYLKQLVINTLPINKIKNSVKLKNLGTHLFVKVPRPGDREMNFSVFESSCHLLLPVLPLIGRGNHVKCPAQGHNKRTCRPISTLTLLNVER